MKATASALLAAFALGACAQHPKPNAAPAPVVFVPATVPEPPSLTVPTHADSSAAKASGAGTVSDSGAVRDSGSVSDRDVATSALHMFGDSAAAPDSAQPSWDIDVHSYETRTRVQHYVSLFTGSAKDHITDRLDAGTKFEGMIRAQFRAVGLPEDLYYLGLIESGYDPNAYSKAAAVGMWQFMAGTARGEGLRVDWWIDERRDPVKSTAAAARFIKGLDDQFGSLYLAAAAYDGGPGRISRGLTRYADVLQDTAGNDLFFQLADRDYLRNETREYVPQLIAAALVAKDPRRYGLIIQPESAFVYDSVRVPPSTSLSAIADACGTTVATMQSLNPQILRGMSPPDDSIEVRVPAGSGAGFYSSFDALSKLERSAVHIVRSKTGEYLSTIGHIYSLTVRQLEEFNPKVRRYKSGRLVPGQDVLVPTPAVMAAARSVPNPSIEIYGVVNGRHIVRKGETLGGLALKYHTTVKHLMELNDMRHDVILIGESLVVSGSASRPRTRRAPSKGNTH
ncbi:MAG TPA: transglycosylase SLT domain-containing protein [Gemmatimonadaceae bacterium]